MLKMYISPMTEDVQLVAGATMQSASPEAPTPENIETKPLTPGDFPIKIL